MIYARYVGLCLGFMNLLNIESTGLIRVLFLSDSLKLEIHLQLTQSCNIRSFFFSSLIDLNSIPCALKVNGLWAVLENFCSIIS